MDFNNLFAEIKHIRNVLTIPQVGRLNYEKFSIHSKTCCLYGQITGFHDSDAARKIWPKQFRNTSNVSDTPGNNYTLLEKFFYHPGYQSTHKDIFKYLKGQIKFEELEQKILNT